MMSDRFRPPIAERTYSSPCLESLIAEISAAIRDETLRTLFATALPSVLDTAITFSGSEPEDADTFIVSGDIPATWHRDATCQIWPYVQFVHDDPALDLLVRGLIRRQARCVLADPYANSFLLDLRRVNDRDIEERVELRPGVWCRRYQLDSFGYTNRLSYEYWKATGNLDPFDGTWLAAQASLVDLIEMFQTGTDRMPLSPYSYQRKSYESFESLPMHGYGQPCRTCGLTRNFFRPSDDFCQLPYHIPTNLLAASGLDHLAEMVEVIGGQDALAARTRRIAGEIRTAVAEYGIVTHPVFGRIYAYEVDGYGNFYLMDDANGPNLLGLPYFGLADTDDPVWRATREYCLSDWNPYYQTGTRLTGIGGPHTVYVEGRSASDQVGLGFIWPLGIAMQAMVSEDDEEIAKCLRYLVTSRTPRFVLPEASWKDDVRVYRRDWFGWPNSFFGELVIKLFRERPYLLERSYTEQ